MALSLIFVLPAPVRATPPPSWKHIPEERTPGGTLCSVGPYRDNVLTEEAIAAEVRRTSYNPTGPPVSGIRVESSDTPVKGSFRYVYVLLREKGANIVVVGYVTPSGWIVSGDFTSAVEPDDFRAFLTSYHLPAAAPQ